VNDLAIIVVSTNEARWLRPCLASVFEHAGPIDLEVIVADNDSTDGTHELVEDEFPNARVVACRNRGFSHANNRGLMAADSRYLLLLNPDTEVLAGTFADLVAKLDERPLVGAVGVKQVTAGGSLSPTVRRFPNALRAWGGALACERWPLGARLLGERELDLSRYERELACDWTSGSFLLLRREALESAGLLDERFFIYCEETDLCLRVKRAGWEMRHVPWLTILHHAGKAGLSPKMEAQAAFARLQYARKNFSAFQRAAYVAAVYAQHALRVAAPGGTERRAASRRALRVLLGLESPPFGPPPPHGVLARSGEAHAAAVGLSASDH
jgi:N-acetylglucosaminyl-diphospho-decaprenol L-rhamnosyltransferase